ncbi:MAG: DoxX family protein [Chitinophagales bacterium]|jgi:hypothetical protein|nr:DoxX family protein [Chitinophagales bacterium]
MNNTKLILWLSYGLQAIIVAILLMGAVMNLTNNEEAVKGAMNLGYPRESVFYLGLILIISAILYAIPKTTILGAILITAWLGGAVATHLIHKDPVFISFFPVVFGFLVWLSIGLRNDKIKALFFEI